MPSITEAMRSTVPEATGKKDLRAEKTSTPAPESQSAEAVAAADAQVDQVELSDSVVRAIEMPNSMRRKSKRCGSPLWKAITRLMRSASLRTCSIWSE